MGLADGVRHIVKGTLHTYVLIALCGIMLPFVFLAIDNAPAGAVVAPAITKLALGCVVLAFVIFRVVIPTMEKTKERPPQQDGGYNSYQTPPYGGQYP